MPRPPLLLIVGLLLSGCIGSDKAAQAETGPGDGADGSDGAAGSDGGDGDSGLDGPTLDLFGYIKLASTQAPIAGVEVWSLDRGGERVVSGADGRWVMAVVERPYMRFRSEAEGLIPVEAWIDPREGANPDYPYPYSMGVGDDLHAFLDPLGASLDLENTAIVFVDAMDPMMRDIAGTEVSLEGSFQGPYREYAPDQWDNLPLTTEDRSDLVYANVPPGQLRLTAVDPDGQPCEVPPGIEVFAGEIAQVSVYCEAMAVASTPAAPGPRSPR